MQTDNWFLACSVPCLRQNLDALNQEETYHARRAHTKSRNGCDGCKRKRVKVDALWPRNEGFADNVQCDEARPKCMRCSTRRESCDYSKKSQRPMGEWTGGEERRIIEMLWSGIPIGATANSQALTVSRISEMLRTNLPIGKLETSPHFRLTMVTELLHHFKQTAARTLGSAAIMSKFITHKCPSPRLLNATLGFSALHLHNLYPDDIRYKLAAWCMGMKALQLFSLCMQDQTEDQDDFYLTYVLVSAMAFFSEDQDMALSTVFSAWPQAATWLSLTPSFSTLVQQVEQQARGRVHVHDQSFRTESDTKNADVVQVESQLSRASPRLYRIYQLGHKHSCATNPYFAVVRHLTCALGGEYDVSGFWELPADLDNVVEYRHLLHNNDPVALLLLAYWLAQLYGTDCWWSKSRAFLECKAICIKLDRCASLDLGDLLDHPKSVYQTYSAEADFIRGGRGRREGDISTNNGILSDSGGQ